jgi:hypothetical protein
MKINEIILEGWFGPSKAEREQASNRKEQEKEYFATLTYKQNNGERLSAQEKDDYERLYEKYGKYNIRRPDEMSHVDLERYAQKYVDQKRKDKESTWDTVHGRYLEPWEIAQRREKKERERSDTRSETQKQKDQAEFDDLTKKLRSNTATQQDRYRYAELWKIGLRYKD